MRQDRVMVLAWIALAFFFIQIERDATVAVIGTIVWGASGWIVNEIKKEKR